MRRMLYVALTAASILTVGAITTARPAPAADLPRAQLTYVFCGAGDAIFCGGMRAYAAEVGGRVRYWHQWRSVVKEIRAARVRSVRLAGHSCGVYAAVEVAKAIRPVRVSKLAAFDAAWFICSTDKAPGNVGQIWSTRRTGAGLGGRSMRDGTRRVRETIRNDLLHIQIGFDAGVRRDAVNFFRGRVDSPRKRR